MAFILAGDFRKGITFEMDSKVMVIVEFLHVKPGKGAAFVRTKIRDVINGGLIEKTFNPNEKFELAHIERKTLEYLYSDGEMFYFMDPLTYEQAPLDKVSCEDALMFVKENMSVALFFSCSTRVSVLLRRGKGIIGNTKSYLLWARPQSIRAIVRRRKKERIKWEHVQ